MDKRLKLATHRGLHTGNIIENTYEAVMMAIACGSDIVEIDLIKSSDDVLFLYHNTEELRTFGSDFDILELAANQIEQLEYLNHLGQPSGRKPERFEAFLAKYNCPNLINLDRSWDHFDLLFNVLDGHPKQDQFIIKSPVTPDFIEIVQERGAKYKLMPIVKTEEELESLTAVLDKLYGIEYIIPDFETTPFTKALVAAHRNSGIETWLNIINLGDKPEFKLSGDILEDQICLNPQPYIEWIREYGFTIIQTDMPYLFNKYTKHD